jgi:hypothetical protein
MKSLLSLHLIETSECVINLFRWFRHKPLRIIVEYIAQSEHYYVHHTVSPHRRQMSDYELMTYAVRHMVLQYDDLQKAIYLEIKKGCGHTRDGEMGQSH